MVISDLLRILWTVNNLSPVNRINSPGLELAGARCAFSLFLFRTVE